MKATRLTSEERGFLDAVAEATYANPFSEDRQRADERIAGMVGLEEGDRGLAAVLAPIREFIARQDAKGFSRVDQFAPEDQELIEQTYLFELFHENAQSVDRLIQDQLARGDEPCRAPFVRRALEEMKRRGIPEPRANLYLAFFYQLRRAYFFIYSSLTGRSACMRTLRMNLWNNVFTRDTRLYVQHLWNRMEDFSTMLLGETGTGKGAAAAAIGRSGFIPYDAGTQCFAESFVRSFVAINLSQFPETLIESELFGHRKGAFTGAVEAHEGMFARCSSHGAVFLDEIGDVSVPVQIKLLKVLQEREFSPVGSHERRRFSGRVIGASNKLLDELRAQGQFRDDFFYRLCSDVIRVPPLRERLAEEPGELDDLVDVALLRIVGTAEQAAALGGFVKASIRRSVAADYAWPGNVRELEQCVRRILITHGYQGDTRPASSPRAALIAEMESGKLTAEELVEKYCKLLHARYGTYEEVARRTNLDRRTVKKHVTRER
jgi:hypothetical protein